MVSCSKNQQYTTALTSDDGNRVPRVTARTESDIRSGKWWWRQEPGQKTAEQWQSVSP